MGEENEVKLHGMWASTYCKRVELALRVKGIRYEYTEEDLGNKSLLLLNYNPVHKKVPVLVHNGKPIVESSIILEYIDETWKNSPSLLPEDAYERAKVRFWASFIQQQLFENIGKMFTSEGETLEKVLKEVTEKLKVFEAGIKEFSPEGASFAVNENLGLLDILVSSIFSPYKAQEEVLCVKLLNQETNPLLLSWVTALNEHPLVKELSPPHDKLVGLLRFIKQSGVSSR